MWLLSYNWRGLVSPTNIWVRLCADVPVYVWDGGDYFGGWRRIVTNAHTFIFTHTYMIPLFSAVIFRCISQIPGWISALWTVLELSSSRQKGCKCDTIIMLYACFCSAVVTHSWLVWPDKPNLFEVCLNAERSAPHSCTLRLFTFSVFHSWWHSINTHTYIWTGRCSPACNDAQYGTSKWGQTAALALVLCLKNTHRNPRSSEKKEMPTGQTTRRMTLTLPLVRTVGQPRSSGRSTIHCSRNHAGAFLVFFFLVAVRTCVWTWAWLRRGMLQAARRQQKRSKVKGCGATAPCGSMFFFLLLFVSFTFLLFCWVVALTLWAAQSFVSTFIYI